MCSGLIILLSSYVLYSQKLFFTLIITELKPFITFLKPDLFAKGKMIIEF